MENTNNSYKIEDFCSIGKDEFLGIVSQKFFDIDHGELTGTQKQAWDREYDDLSKCLKGKKGRVLFEYNIPSLSKTIDVVLLLNGKIFVLEYKVGSSQYDKADILQVEQYALLLKYCHSCSNDKWIVPILIATEADKYNNKYSVKADDMVYDTLRANSKTLPEIIDEVCSLSPYKGDSLWEESWEHGIYKASPTIIDAARNVWRENNVEGFKKGESDESTRLSAESYIRKVVEETQKRPEGHRHSICFVTGVPGAGKTLVGLNLSVAFQEHGASMLSGNGPLVAVLAAALKQDYQHYQKEKATLKDIISVDAIIRSAYGYKKEIFEKRLDYQVGKGSVSLKENADRGSQHVIIFDEAQRAWTKQKMIKTGKAGKKYWQEDLFPFSEPGILLWDLNLRDWGVFVCLVGGGQEINEGEAGICEWMRALADNKELQNWHIYMADELKGAEYERKDDENRTIQDYRKRFMSEKRLTVDKSLHLTASQRTPRSEKVSEFIQELLECNIERASSLYGELKGRYPIYLTRNLEKAKEKLRERHEQLVPMNGDKNNTRMGMLMSSNAKRLRPLGYASNGAVKDNGKVANWFLVGDDNVLSSNFLEIALDEFCVQGLELDVDVVMWDGDFRYNSATNSWDYFRFNDKEWSQITDEKITGREKSEEKREEKKRKNRTRETNRFYMKNAYRVLLTRARAGMIIFVPEGDDKDKSRAPEVYDGTFNYLRQIITEVI